MDPRLVLLAPDDNCIVAARTLLADTRVEIDGAEILVARRVDTGHKLARWTIAAGDTVFKYGAAIGHATAPIAIGEHIHSHNLASDYLPAAGAR